MAAPLAYLNSFGAGANWSSLARWPDMLRGIAGRSEARTRDAAGQDIIDVQAKRVRVEDLAAQRKALGLQRPDSEVLDGVVKASRASRSYAEAMAEFEDEMLRQPFMYAKSRGVEGGMVLKSAPLKRGIFIDVEA